MNRKKDLPYLNQERLDIIFERVYELKDEDKPFHEDRLNGFLVMIKAMQHFNHWYRPEDTRDLFDLMDPVFNFERNSEGTTMWLALILAIGELYGFSDQKLLEVMKQVKVRK